MHPEGPGTAEKLVLSTHQSHFQHSLVHFRDLVVRWGPEPPVTTGKL